MVYYLSNRYTKHGLEYMFHIASTFGRPECDSFSIQSGSSISSPWTNNSAVKSSPSNSIQSSRTSLMSDNGRGGGSQESQRITAKAPLPAVGQIERSPSQVNSNASRTSIDGLALNRHGLRFPAAALDNYSGFQDSRRIGAKAPLPNVTTIDRTSPRRNDSMRRASTDVPTLHYRGLIFPAAALDNSQKIRFFCTYCTEKGVYTSFKFKADWKRHEANMHETGQEWSCSFPTCSEIFDRFRDYKQHSQHHHPGHCALEDAVVQLLPKEAYGCGFEKCKAVLPNWDSRCTHAASHMWDGMTKEQWHYTTVLRNLLRRGGIGEISKFYLSKVRKDFQKGQSELLWHPKSARILRQKLECGDFRPNFHEVLTSAFKLGLRIEDALPEIFTTPSADSVPKSLSRLQLWSFLRGTVDISLSGPHIGLDHVDCSDGMQEALSSALVMPRAHSSQSINQYTVNSATAVSGQNGDGVSLPLPLKDQQHRGANTLRTSNTSASTLEVPIQSFPQHFETTWQYMEFPSPQLPSSVHRFKEDIEKGGNAFVPRTKKLQHSPTNSRATTGISDPFTQCRISEAASPSAAELEHAPSHMLHFLVESSSRTDIPSEVGAGRPISTQDGSSTKPNEQCLSAGSDLTSDTVMQDGFGNDTLDTARAGYQELDYHLMGSPAASQFGFDNELQPGVFDNFHSRH